MALLWIMLSTDVLLVRERPVRVSSAVYSSGWGRKVGKILQPASRPSHIDVAPRPPESSIFPRLTHCYALRREVGSCLSFKCPSQTKKQVKKKIKSRKRRFNQIGSKKKGRLTIVYYGILRFALLGSQENLRGVLDNTLTRLSSKIILIDKSQNIHIWPTRQYMSIFPLEHHSVIPKSGFSKLSNGRCSFWIGCYDIHSVETLTRLGNRKYLVVHTLLHPKSRILETGTDFLRVVSWRETWHQSRALRVIIYGRAKTLIFSRISVHMCKVEKECIKN